MPEKQPKKEQHYVPQTYLRGFSQDSASVYEYNFRLERAIEKPVSIRSICREQYLYEVRNQNSDIININYIEDTLCGYEDLFSDYRRKLLNKAIVKANYGRHCFLTKGEKDFWRFFTALQMMRSPFMLYGIKDIMLEELPGQITPVEAYNIAVAFCLPFFKKPEPGEFNALLHFISVLKTKILTVGYVESDHLFTSEHSMYGVRNPEKILDFKKLWFPISSNCVLLFTDPNEMDRKKKNCLIPFSAEDVREINKGITYVAGQMIISKYPFSEADIQLIEEARKERAEDEKRKSL